MNPTQPQIVVDSFGFALAEPGSGTLIGAPPGPPLRVVATLPLRDGPQQLRPRQFLADVFGFVLADPATGAIVGLPGGMKPRRTHSARSATARAVRPFPPANGCPPALGLAAGKSAKLWGTTKALPWAGLLRPLQGR